MIYWLFSLFVGAHNSILGSQGIFGLFLYLLWYLRVFYLKQQALLICIWILLFDYSISRHTDFLVVLHSTIGVLNDLVLLHTTCSPLLDFSQLSSMQICLMLLACGVRQIWGLIGMQSEAQPALIRTQMVTHDIWIIWYIRRLDL